MNSRDAERQELERAVELLGRSTRPGRLLAYLGERTLEQREDQLTEFNIATRVFGRSEKSFDPAQDAVVRVEAHRLRKKLREIYAQGGGIQGLQISLPAGTYVPKFSYAADPLPADHGSAHEEEASSEEAAIEKQAVARSRKRTLYLSASVALVCAAILAFVMIEAPQDQNASAQARSSKAASPALPATAEAVTEVHIMAGHSGSDVIDNSGVRWTPDRFYTGGGGWSINRGFVRGTSRPFLFTTSRTGEFSYDIPVGPGSYELRLFFVSPNRVGDEKLASFDVSVNGQPLLPAYDVNISAHGSDVADEKVFRDITPDEDGFVRVRFTNQMAAPWVNALELTPGTPGKLNPIRIITQPTSFVDHKGQRWRADDYYINGFRSTERRKVSGTDDPELFSAERYGHFRYAIPVDPRGRYTVILHFAEFYFGPQLEGGGGVGSRVFNVFCNGQTLLEDFDIFKEAGSLRVVSKTFTNIKPSAQGKINLTFEPVVNFATVSGIEVLDESN